MCFVIAKRFTKVSPDQALLTGLLHVLGRLYIIMRSKDAPELSDTALREIIDGWHANIGKAILETWGLPETLQGAVEHQDEFEIEFDGDITLGDVLIAAKLVQRGEQDLKLYPSLRRVGIAPGDMDKHADEIRNVRSSLSE